MNTAAPAVAGPRQRSTAWTALAVLTVTVCLFAVGVTAHVSLAPGVARTSDAFIIWMVALLGLPAVGTLIVTRQPRNPVGWLLLGIGLAFGAAAAVTELARLNFTTHPGPAAVGALLGGVLWKAGLVQIPLLMLLFPTGRLPCRRWLPVLVALLTMAGAAMIGGVVLPGPADYSSGTGPDNPWAVPVLAQALGPVTGAPGFAVFGVLVLACAGSLLLRFRRGDQQTRAQLQWLALGSGVLAATVFASGLLQLFVFPGTPPALVPWPLTVLQAVGLLTLAAAIAVAMLRYRLFDVDWVASRALAYAGLAVVITLLYLTLVVGIGAVLRQAPGAEAISPLLVAAIVAVTFHPLRTRLIRVANRLVYGRRASPYQLLADTTSRIAATLPASEALPGLARALAEGTDASTGVWLRDPDGWRLAASWPTGASPARPATGRHTFDVHQGEELLGALVVDRYNPLGPTEQRLASDLAAQAGILLRNAALVDALRASASRLVAVQETTRRRLERDLHDGAQQQLTAITMKLGLARSALPGNPHEAGVLIEELIADARAAMHEVREIARGVYPPLLSVQGLLAALTARCRQMPIPTRLSCPSRRYSVGVEAAVYFCCAEALQNVAKHSNAAQCEVRLRQDRDRLHLAVTDDGRGFNPLPPHAGNGLTSMTDRLTALGGGLTIDGDHQPGTMITGWVPIAAAHQCDDLLTH